MENIKIIAFTHKTVGLEEIGQFHIGDTERDERLINTKETLELDELLFISTCNRVEIVVVKDGLLNEGFLRKLFNELYPSWGSGLVSNAIEKARCFDGLEAVEHIFNVASSLDSLVVGEREIITQVRNSFENCKEIGITGNILNLLIRSTIETAKKVYTETNISRNPVSVVSLAFRMLKEKELNEDAKVLVVGAGQTNYAMTNFLYKNGFKNFSIYNRTLANAEELAKKIDGSAFPLAELKGKKEFDIILTCTGSDGAIFEAELYKELLGEDKSQKVVVDLAVPNDFDPKICRKEDVSLISINEIKQIADRNLERRKKEVGKSEVIVAECIDEFDRIYKERMVEIAMKDVPKKIKEIHSRALEQVFAKEIESLDSESKETLEKVLSYVEKKYISVPMKMAREIMTGTGQ